MDVPEVARRTGADVYGSPNTCALLRILGVSPDRLYALSAGDQLRLAGGSIELAVFPAVHGKILGRSIFTGPLSQQLRPPLHLRDYRMDVTFSFLLQAAGYRLLDWSSEDVAMEEAPLHAASASPADVLFVKPFGTRAYYELLLQSVQPRLVIPIHWDNFFRPLSQPLRPLLSPPTWSWSRRPFQRVDLTAFRRVVQQVAPAARVFIPDPLRTYDLRQLL
jgi:L-ascorbate metabolism protein UlaG (beta-lactamase superfamily)